MLRHSKIFRIRPSVEGNSEQARISDARDVTLDDCLEAASGTFRRRLEGLRTVVRKEKIWLEREDPVFIVYSCSAEIRAPRVMALGDEPTPFIRVSFPIWLMRKWPLVLIFDAGRKLSFTAACMTSMRLYGAPSLIEPVRLTRDDFLMVVDGLKSDQFSQQGAVQRITFRNAEINGQSFEQVTLRGESLEETEWFRSLRDSSEHITDLAFLSPLFPGTGRRLSCRITRLASLTFYSSGVADFEIERLAEFLEPSLSNSVSLENPR